MLESKDKKLKDLKRKYIRCSNVATIKHLKKFLALKCLDDIEKHYDIDIMCDGELIPKDHTLKFVYITRWRTKDPPLKLTYMPKIEIDMNNANMEVDDEK